MHIFLTGPSKIGKSSIIQKTIYTLDLIPGGFTTFSEPPDQNGLMRVFMQHASQPQDINGDDTYVVGFRYANKSKGGDTDAFDIAGPQLLNKQSKDNLIIMDELGFMENRASVFQKAVLSALDGSKPILGVIKPISTPFLNEIREHPDVFLMEITLENRDNASLVLTKLTQTILSEKKEQS